MNRGIDLRVINTSASFEDIRNGVFTGSICLGDECTRPEEDLIGVFQDVLHAVLGHGDAHVPALGAGRQVVGASEATRVGRLTRGLNKWKMCFMFE